VLEIVIAFLLEDGEKFRQYLRVGTRRGVEAGNDFFASENLKRIQEVEGIFELIGRKAKEFQIMKARELQMRLTAPN